MTAPDLFSWLNPILQKELRTTFRTKRFLAAFITSQSVIGAVILILAAAQTATQSDTDPSQIGQAIYAVFIIGLGLVTWFIIPGFACAALTGERERETYDLLVTTALRPSDLIRGKLLAVFAYVFVFYAGALPLVSLAFLFGGVALGDILLSYVALTMAALFAVSLSLMFSAVYSTTRRAVSSAYAILGLACLFLVPGTVILLQGRLSPWEQLMSLPVPVIVAIFFSYASLISLFLIGATNALKSPNENRSTSLRVFFLIVTAVGTGLGIWILMSQLGSIPADQGIQLFGGWIAVTGSVLLVFPFLFCAEPVRRSRRLDTLIRRASQSMRPLKRLFFPGSASGFVFTMVWGTILLVGVAAALYFDLDLAAVRFHAQGWQLGTYNGLIVLGLAWVFLFFYASLGLCLSVFEFRPQVVRVLMLSLIILANLVPVIFVSIESLNREKRRPSMNGYFISQGVCVISALTPPGRMLEGGSARSDDWVIPPPEAVFGSDYVSLFTAVPWVRRGESPSPHRMALPQYMVGGGAYLFLGCLLLGFAWGRYRRRLRHALAQEAREREAMESGPSDPPRATTEMTGPGSSGSEADEEPRDGPTGHETEPRPG